MAGTRGLLRRDLLSGGKTADGAQVSSIGCFDAVFYLKVFYLSAFLVNATPTTRGPELAAMAAPI